MMINNERENMIDLNRRVYVYFNLHKKVWSVRQKGTPVEHTKHIMLEDVSFLVGQAGRKKVLKEKRKNVHAFVVGLLTNPCQKFVTSYIVKQKYSAIIYNPYMYQSFVRLDDKKSVKTARYVDMMIHNDYIEHPMIAWGVV